MLPKFIIPALSGISSLGGIIFYRGILYTFLRKKQGVFHAYFAWHGAFSVVLELLGFLAKKCYLLEQLEFPGRETACIRACLYFFPI